MKQALSPPGEREFTFDSEQFRFLAALANERTGIVLAESKRDMVYGRLVRRLRALKLSSFAQYCELLSSQEGADEVGQLVNAITTNLTSFFREAHHFEHLHNEVLKPMASATTNRHLRIWSAACSSGMEPYSIAMTLKSAVPDLRSWDAKILATDIDSNMLNTGMKGEYAAADIKDLPAQYKSHIEHGDTPARIRMSDTLKDLIAFRGLNLLEHWPMKGKFDAIFCRNVVIYFDKPTKQKLFARMADIMKPDGWLYIGRTIYRKVK